MRILEEFLIRLSFIIVTIFFYINPDKSSLLYKTIIKIVEKAQFYIDGSTNIEHNILLLPYDNEKLYDKIYPIHGDIEDEQIEHDYYRDVDLEEFIMGDN